MTLSEFKAWFEGFSEGIDTAPTEAQFAKIKAKVALITGTPTTYPVFVDRYRTYLDGIWRRPEYYPYTADYASHTHPGGHLNAVGRADGIGVCNFAQVGAATKGDDGQTFDSHAAMRELGRAEALN